MTVKGIFRPYVNGPLFYFWQCLALLFSSSLSRFQGETTLSQPPWNHSSYLSSVPCFSHATFSSCTQTAAAAAAKSLQSCPTLCDPIDGSPPDSSVPGILQARILEWVAISFSSACMHAKSLQLCLTLCNPMDSSPPGSSVHRIL